MAAALVEIVDKVVVGKHLYSRAVAQVYRHWYDVPDEEVIQTMQE